jgi:23S rRNA (pseudouridine1915-N3)-methyltransferase
VHNSYVQKIRIFTFGKARQDFVKLGEAEYLARLKHYAKLEVVELKDQSIKNTSEEVIKKREAEQLLEALGSNRPLILLDSRGKQLSSPELAARFEEWQRQPNCVVSFAIGGALGFSADLLGKSDYTISLSRFTFPHQLVRVILVEQIYRALSINRGEPYHK